MPQQVSILGGRGRIGTSVALDLLAHTPAEITITGRTATERLPQALQPFRDRVRYLVVNLDDDRSLAAAIAPADLVIHCAGPFRHRQPIVLERCIAFGVNYVDVSDDRTFTQAALALHSQAEAVGITAVVNTGIFPGISNSMARLAIEQLDLPTAVDLSYVVAGSGGAGITVMRTTFLNIQHPFDAWIDGIWQQIRPYTDRSTVEFPPPFGQASVYWFDMPESLTLAQTFPVQTVTTKFGTFPNFYNHLTWLTAHWFPQSLMQQPRFIEGLARISHAMTAVTDRFSGTGVAMRVDVRGQKHDRPAHYWATFVHDCAAIATGLGTGSISEYLLSGKMSRAGVYPVEQIVTTPVFTEIIASRQLEIDRSWD